MSAVTKILFSDPITHALNAHFRIQNKTHLWAAYFVLFFCFLCCDSLLFTHFEFRFVLFTNKLHAIHNVRFDCKSTVVAFVQFGSVLFCSWFAFMMFIVDFNSNMSMQRYICNLYGHRIVCVESFLLDR